MNANVTTFEFKLNETSPGLYKKAVTGQARSLFGTRLPLQPPGRAVKPLRLAGRALPAARPHRLLRERAPGRSCRLVLSAAKPNGVRQMLGFFRTKSGINPTYIAPVIRQVGLCAEHALAAAEAGAVRSDRASAQ
jgi:hypothetical protein